MLQNIKNIFHYFESLWWMIWFRFPSRSLTIIGVTGTDGKTTTTTLIYEVLKAAEYKVSMITSVRAEIAGHSYDTGFHVTTPGSYWIQKYLREAVNNGDTHMVLEVTSHSIAQHRIGGVHFAIGVLTNVTHEHLDWHKTFDHYLQTKLSLLARADTVVINRDEAAVYNKAVGRFQKKRVIAYGIHREARVTPKSFPFHSELVGEFNRYNCLAAIAVGYALAIPNQTILHAVKSFPGVVGRMEVIPSDKPYTIIVDFAHTPNAIEQVLKALRRQTKKRIIHVFGSAGLRDGSKRPLMGRASSLYADVIILTEEDFRTESVDEIIKEITKGIAFGKQPLVFPNRKDAIKQALLVAKRGDIVVVTGKGHEKSLCRGTIEHPWSDQEEIKKLLKSM